MKTIKNILCDMLSAIYPKKCICCREIIDDNSFICSICESKIERNSLDNICLLCGFEKESCVCKYNVYRFDSLVCVFKNCGLAQKAYYAYKFLKQKHYADFFASEMCKAVERCYKDVEFDFITYVPSINRLGFNHSGYIAKEMSKKLNLHFEENLLYSAKHVKKQHKSTIKERIENVEGKYKCNYNISGARVLLVDDIKTTGATVDECAKVLLFAGAESVHCITALGSSENN